MNIAGTVYSLIGGHWKSCFESPHPIHYTHSHSAQDAISNVSSVSAQGYNAGWRLVERERKPASCYSLTTSFRRSFLRH